jgi:hypothetical protein
MELEEVLREACADEGVELKVVDLCPSNPQPAGTALIQIEPEKEQRFATYRLQVETVLKIVQARTIDTMEDYTQANTDSNLLANLRKAIEDYRKERTGPINNFLRDINDAYKLLTDPLAEADKLNSQKIIAYRHEQERKRLKAEEVNRQAQEVARKQAALNNGEFTVDTTPVPTPEVAPAKVYTPVGSVGTMKVRKYRVVNFAKLEDQYKIENSVLLNKVTKAGIPEIPGVEFYYEETLRRTAARG